MAKDIKVVRVVGVKPTSVGMLQGTLFSLIGLFVAISYSISATVQFTDATESVLGGLTLGLAHGFVAIIFVPIIYFVGGWVIGTLYGFIIDYILHGSGGLVVKTDEVKGEK